MIFTGEFAKTLMAVATGIKLIPAAAINMSVICMSAKSRKKPGVMPGIAVAMGNWTQVRSVTLQFQAQRAAFQHAKRIRIVAAAAGMGFCNYLMGNNAILGMLAQDMAQPRNVIFRLANV